MEGHSFQDLSLCRAINCTNAEISADPPWSPLQFLRGLGNWGIARATYKSKQARFSEVNEQKIIRTNFLTQKTAITQNLWISSPTYPLGQAFWRSMKEWSFRILVTPVRSASVSVRLLIRGFTGNWLYEISSRNSKLVERSVVRHKFTKFTTCV